MTRSRRTLWTYAFLAFGALGAGTVLFFFDPAITPAYPACPFHSLTGLACPTCGGLRATHLLLHGQVRAAFEMNPFLFFAGPVVALFLIRPALARPRWVPWVAIGLLAAFFIYRNWP